MPEPPKPAARYGTGYAADRFRGIGGDLLRTFPPLAQADDPPAMDPTAPTFATHGTYFLAAIVLGPDGFRVSPCPVCHTRAILPWSGGWIPLRCESCGTEFVATDGSAPPPAPEPPPPPPPPPPLLSPPPPERGQLVFNLADWIASGAPDHWVAARKGAWSETEFAGLLRSLEVSPYWPLDPPGVRAALQAASDRYRAKLPRTSYVFARDGRRYTKCPVCAVPLMLPPGAAGEVLLTCPFCDVRFVVEVPPAPRRPPPRRKSPFRLCFEMLVKELGWPALVSVVLIGVLPWLVLWLERLSR